LLSGVWKTFLQIQPTDQAHSNTCWRRNIFARSVEKHILLRATWPVTCELAPDRVKPGCTLSLFLKFILLSAAARSENKWRN